MTHDDYMRQALIEAEIALKLNEVPVGAVVVKDGKIIGRGHNTKEQANLVTGHAEINAINDASKKLGSWRLDGCSLYVTMEPCVMCSGAILQSRIKYLIYGTVDYKHGSHQSIINLFNKSIDHKVEVISGVLEESCKNMLKTFFITLRKDKDSV
ncbi:MAG: nucleoside deaminase [Candidatus Izemoplasmataceae bacterium]